MSQRNILPKLYNLHRRCFRGLPNETQHNLMVNDYKYTVSFTECKNHGTKQSTAPMVFLPAMGQTIRDYPWLKKHLSQYNDVITIAHTSTPHELVHENADFFENTTDLDFQVDIACIKNSMDYFDINNANLLGISFGGMMAHMFAREYPLRVNSMVLSSVGLYISEPCEKSMIDGFPYLYSGDYKTAAKISAETFSSNPLKRRLLTKQFSKLLTCKIYSKLYGICCERVLKYFHLTRYRDLNLPSIGRDIETLLICANSDDVFPLTSSLCLAETIQNCTVENVDGCHLWMLDRDKQDMFCEQVSNFFVNDMCAMQIE